MRDMTKDEIRTIDRPVPTEFEIDSILWKERDKWGFIGFMLGSLMTSAAWLIALYLYDKV